MIVVWVNKADWKKPGPIVYMGLLNARACADLGYETHCFVSPGDASDTATDLREFYGVGEHPLLHIHRVPRLPRWREVVGRHIYRQALAFVAARAEREDVAVVTREGGLLPALSRLCRTHPRVLGLYEAHDFNADPSYLGRVTWTRRLKGWTERTFLPRMNGLLCITHAQQNLYQGVLPQVPARTYPLGCLTFSGQDRERRRALKRLVYLGHLHHEKGMGLLLRAIPLLANRGIELWVFGGYDNQIRRYLESLNLPSVHDRLRFFPFLSPREMHRHLADEVSVGVVPLRDTFYNRYLTCPVKALDYLSHQLPVIASDLPATREVLGGAGVFIPPDDEQALVSAAAEILDSPQRYRDLSALSAQRSEELRWTNRARAISVWINELFAAKRKGLPMGIERETVGSMSA